MAFGISPVRTSAHSYFTTQENSSLATPVTLGPAPEPGENDVSVSAIRAAFNQRTAQAKQLYAELTVLEKNLKAHPDKPFPVKQYASKLRALDMLQQKNDNDAELLNKTYGSSNDEAFGLSIDLSFANFDPAERLKSYKSSAFLNSISYMRMYDAALEPLEQLRNTVKTFDEERQERTFTAMKSILISVKSPTPEQVTQYINLLTSDACYSLLADYWKYGDFIAERLEHFPNGASAINTLITSEAFKKLGPTGPYTNDPVFAQKSLMLKWAEGGLPFDNSGKTAIEKTQQMFDASRDPEGGEDFVNSVNTLFNYDYSVHLNGDKQYNAALQKVAVDNLRRIVAYYSKYQDGSRDEKALILRSAVDMMIYSKDFARRALDNNWNDSHWTEDAIHKLMDKITASRR